MLLAYPFSQEYLLLCRNNNLGGDFVDKKEQAVILASSILKRSADVDVRSNFKDSEEILILFQDVNDEREYEKPITLSALIELIERSL